MTSDGLFGWLASAPCGAFAVSLDQTIVFWNGGARPRGGTEMLRSYGRGGGQRFDTGLCWWVRVRALRSGRDGAGADEYDDAVRVRRA